MDEEAELLRTVCALLHCPLPPLLPLIAGTRPSRARSRGCSRPSRCDRTLHAGSRKLRISRPNRSISMRNESCPSMQLSGLK